mgnify:CR=1 FL=1
MQEHHVAGEPARRAEIMRRHHDLHAAGRYGADDVLDGFGRGGIEARGRLVEKQHRRIARQRAGQRHPYRWESVLKGSLPQFLDRHGFRNRTLVGLSMSASQAVIVGNQRRDLYQRVVSMSGFMNLVATGMQTMLRAAAWDAGHYNLNDMWGWFPNAEAFRHSPTENLPSMNGLHLWMYAGTGVWGDHQPPGANNTDFYITGFNSTAIEAVSGEQSRTFALAAPLFGVNLRTDFPITGTHAWGYWQQAIWNIYNNGWFRNG